MPQHDERFTVGQMIDYAREAVQFSDGRSVGDLRTDRMFNLSMARLLEVIGEAATRLSPELRERHPLVPWGDIIGLRNRLIHAYDALDEIVIWRTLREDLPELIPQLQAILDELAAADS
jgi:uncharacterized protein with HEPN domain